jgi:hypothetical protein
MTPSSPGCLERHQLGKKDGVIRHSLDEEFALDEVEELHRQIGQVARDAQDAVDEERSSSGAVVSVMGWPEAATPATERRAPG